MPVGGLPSRAGPGAQPSTIGEADRLLTPKDARYTFNCQS